MASRWLALAAGLIAVLVLAAVLTLTLRPLAAPPSPDQRAYAIAEQLACPICQGLSVAASPSVLAQQMRQIIRQQVAAGQSDAQIEQWFVDRYGQSILLTPPQRGFGLLAWWVPVLLGMLGVSVVVLALVRFTRARPPEEVLPVLSDAEVQHYQAALDEALAARDDESADGVDASPVQPAPPPGIALRPEAPR